MDFYFLQNSSSNFQHPLLKQVISLMEKGHTIVMCLKKRERNEKEEEDDDNNNGDGDGGEEYEEKRANKNQSEKGEPNENAPGAKAFKRIEWWWKYIYINSNTLAGTRACVLYSIRQQHKSPRSATETSYRYTFCMYLIHVRDETWKKALCVPLQLI